MLLLLLLAAAVVSQLPWCAATAPQLLGELPAVESSDGYALPVPWAHATDASFPFVRARGVQLLVGDSPYYHVGANLWHGAHLGAASGLGSDRERLNADLDALVGMGVTHVRVLGASEGPDTEPWRVSPSLQPCPGVYNAAVLDGFDYLLYSLGKRRIRATVVLGNEWPWSGGHAQYVRWAQRNATQRQSECNSASRHAKPDMSSANWRKHGFQSLRYPGSGGAPWGDWMETAGQFYVSDDAQAMWRDTVRFLLTHENRYTGVAAVDDPTVLAWQLANEPRPKGGSALWSRDIAPFVRWLNDAALFIKGLAPHQLVASGMEGDTAHVSLAQSTLLTQNSSAIDIVTAHVWPMNFRWLDPSSPASAAFSLAASRAYLAAHIATAAALGKPLLVEEFGWPRDGGSLSPLAPTEGRDLFYEAVFSMVLASAESQGALAGASFWGYAGLGRPDVRYSQMPSTLPSVCTAQPSSELRALDGGPIDWGACFFDEGARPVACPYWVWTTPPASWPNATFRGQSALLHDPPHEVAGWYSVYSCDASTIHVIGTAAKRLAKLTGCAASVVHSARAAARDAGVEHDGLYGAASCVAAVGQPATEEEQSHTQLLSPRTKACIAAALPLKHHANAAPGPDAYRHFSAYDQAEMPE